MELNNCDIHYIYAIYNIYIISTHIYLHTTSTVSTQISTYYIYSICTHNTISTASTHYIYSIYTHIYTAHCVSAVRYKVSRMIERRSDNSWAEKLCQSLDHEAGQLLIVGRCQSVLRSPGPGPFLSFSTRCQWDLTWRIP